MKLTDIQKWPKDGPDDPAPALGWMAAREAAAGVAEDMNPDIWDYHTGNRSRFADDPVARTIRALPAPTSAQLLAEAFRLPEIAALLAAAKGAYYKGEDGMDALGAAIKEASHE